jgi:hypothetical protein
MLPPSIIFLGFVLPALIVGIVLTWGWRCIGALAVFAAFGLAFWKLREAPGWPPGRTDVFSWVFYCAISLAIIGILDELLVPPIWLRAGILAVLWRTVLRIFLGRLAPQTLSNTAVEQAIDLTTGVALVWWLALEQLSLSRPAFVTPVLLMILSAGAALLLYCWGTAEETKLAVALVGISLAAAAAMLFPRRGPLPRGVAGGIGIILLLMLSHSYFYSPDDFSRAQQAFAGLFLLSPLLAFAGDLPRVRHWRPSGRAAVRLLAVLLAVGIASAWTLRDYLHAVQDMQQDE